MKEKLHWPDTLRHAMKEADVNNVELGREIGVSHVAIGNYLKGDKPKSEHLLALANFFKLPMDWFFGSSYFLKALEERGIEFERHSAGLTILLKETGSVSSGKILMELGRLLDSGISPAELLRRLRNEPATDYKKKVSSKAKTDVDIEHIVLEVSDELTQKKPSS